jgi:hypothetical protein
LWPFAIVVGVMSERGRAKRGFVARRMSAPYGYERISSTGEVGIKLVKNELVNNKYRMMFDNGEVVVVNYSLRNSKQIVRRDMVKPDVVRIPDSETLNWLNVVVCESSYRQGNSLWKVLVFSSRNYGIEKVIGYEWAVRRVRNWLFEKSVDKKVCEERKEGVSAVEVHKRALMKVFEMRAWQVVQFSAHTIQLFFRQVMEKRRKERVCVVHYFLEEQDSVTYLNCEFVLREICSFLLVKKELL